MLLEMHCHTREHSPCSSVGAADLLKQLYRKGVQGAVITDHHYLWGEQELRSLRHDAEAPDHFLIFSGQEVRTSDLGDVLVYGAGEIIPKGTPLADIRLGYPGAALVLAHPYRDGRLPREETFANPSLDGIEIFSSNHSVAENARGLRDWHRLRFTALAGTDTHGGSYAGAYPTLFDHPADSIEELAAEIRKGRCRPFLKEIPRSGANERVDEVIIGAKGENEERQRIIIRRFGDAGKLLQAERSYYIREEIARHGFDRGTYRVPKVVGEDKESMVLIEQGLRGKSLFERMIRSGSGDNRYFVELSARWLARLHNLRLRVTPPAEFLEREPERLARYVERFASAGHRHTRRIAQIAEAVQKAETALISQNPGLPVQGHGDYHPKNIYIGQDNLMRRESVYVAAIDFDSSSCLPPAFDVGGFLAQFRNQFNEYPHILAETGEDIFLGAYLETAKATGPDFLNRVELFRARTDLSIASYLVKLGLGDSENLWRVIVEAEQALSRSGFIA